MNYLLLLVYIYQGSMLSIFTQIMPILLLENGFQYKDQGLWSLVAYPFFFKILFAPMVDVIYSKKIGRRKSYIIPCTIGMSLLLIIMSTLSIKSHYLLFCIIGFINTTLLGIQDNAIDGLATDLCKQTKQSVSHIINIAYTISNSFLSNFLFHSLNNYHLCSLETYLKCVAIFGLILAIYIIKNVKEDENKQEYGKLKNFKQVINGIISNDNLLLISCLLFFDRYAVSPIEASFRLKIAELGFNKAYVSWIDTAIMPLKIAVGFIYQKYFSKYNYEHYGYVQGLRLISCIFAVGTIFLVEIIKIGDIGSYISFIIASSTWWIVFNLTYIVKGNFQMRITTPGYEATTMALMNSLGSLGGKTSFSLSLMITDYINYYWFAIFGLIAQLIVTIKTIPIYKKVYKLPVEKWHILDLKKQV